MLVFVYKSTNQMFICCLIISEVTITRLLKPSYAIVTPPWNIAHDSKYLRLMSLHRTAGAQN